MVDVLRLRCSQYNIGKTYIPQIRRSGLRRPDGSSTMGEPNADGLINVEPVK